MNINFLSIVSPQWHFVFALPKNTESYFAHTEIPNSSSCFQPTKTNQKSKLEDPHPES